MAGDRSGLRRRQGAAGLVTAVLVVCIGLPVGTLFGHIRAEWALAFGATRLVSATVTGVSPPSAAEFSRSCTEIRVDVVWPAPGGTHAGYFTVCEGDVSKYPAGKVISVAVASGDSSVIAGESRAEAIFGVALESVMSAFLLLLVAVLVRVFLMLHVPVTRLRTAPWLPADARRRVARARESQGQPMAVFFDPGAMPCPADRDAVRAGPVKDLPSQQFGPAGELAVYGKSDLDLVILGRKDRERLEPGRVWVVPTGRSLWRRRRSGPYAVVRASDLTVFWGMGKPLPGTGW